MEASTTAYDARCVNDKLTLPALCHDRDNLNSVGLIKIL